METSPSARLRFGLLPWSVNTVSVGSWLVLVGAAFAVALPFSGQRHMGESPIVLVTLLVLLWAQLPGLPETDRAPVRIRLVFTGFLMVGALLMFLVIPQVAPTAGMTPLLLQ